MTQEKDEMPTGKHASRPWPGDDVAMDGVEATIGIASVPDDQPRADEGIWTIVDQYGEDHLVETDGADGWTIVVPALGAPRGAR